jgi:hypothetical protein
LNNFYTPTKSTHYISAQRVQTTGGRIRTTGSKITKEEEGTSKTKIEKFLDSFSNYCQIDSEANNYLSNKPSTAIPENYQNSNELFIRAKTPSIFKHNFESKKCFKKAQQASGPGLKEKENNIEAQNELEIHGLNQKEYHKTEEQELEMENTRNEEKSESKEKKKEEKKEEGNTEEKVSYAKRKKEKLNKRNISKSVIIKKFTEGKVKKMKGKKKNLNHSEEGIEIISHAKPIMYESKTSFQKTKSEHQPKQLTHNKLTNQTQTTHTNHHSQSIDVITQCEEIFNRCLDDTFNKENLIYSKSLLTRVCPSSCSGKFCRVQNIIVPIY